MKGVFYGYRWCKIFNTWNSKKIGNKDEELDKNEIDLFTAECRKYKNLTNTEKQSIFNVVKTVMSDDIKIPTDETVWDKINETPPTV